MTSVLSTSQAIENMQPFPLPGLVSPFSPVIAGLDPATQADGAARASLDHRAKPGDDSGGRPRFMGLFRRILRNRIGRPRFMGSFRRIPRRHLRRPRFMGLNARKKAAPEMQSPNLIPDPWHLTSDPLVHGVECPK